MPELPEVETVARQLQRRIQGQCVFGLRILDEKLRVSPAPRLKGLQVARVDRFEKQVRIRFEGAGRPRWLLVHLRMTGRLHWSTEGEAPKHVRAIFTLERGRLLFIDTRRFGTFTWVGDACEFDRPGVDPTMDAFTPERLKTLLEKSRTPLKPWLLRQDRIVGLGNIYASEILWRAGLSPRRRAGRLRPSEIAKLHEAVRSIIERAIENCGTTFSDFQDTDGSIGSYQRFLKVYGREGEPCPRCGSAIARLVQQQRSTFFCPACQRTA